MVGTQQHASLRCIGDETLRCRRCIRLLFLLTAGVFSAISGRAQLSGQNPQPTALYVRAADANGGQVQNGSPVPCRYSGRCEPVGYESRRILIGSWLLPGRILESELQTLTRGEHFAGAALVIGILALISRPLWKRQTRRSRVWNLRISPQELHSAMSSGHAPLIMDLRSPLDMLPDPRMIPGAVRFTQEEISVVAAALPKDRDIVLYCTCPKQETSVDLALSLTDMGFTHVRLLSGGFQAWKQLGYELHDAPDSIHWRGQTAATTGQ